MALGSWEPDFSFDDGSEGAPGRTVAMDDITALYECLKIALGPPVEMNDERQSRTRRRKSKDDTEKATNDGISYQAAKMTKCIVNYMVSGADTTVFEQENLLATTTGPMGRYEVLDGSGGADGQILFASDDDNLVDLYWEINYMKAPVSSITIDNHYVFGTDE